MRFNVTSRQPVREGEAYKSSKNILCALCLAILSRRRKEILLKALKEIQRWLIVTIERLAETPRPKDIDIGSFESVFYFSFYLCEEVTTFRDPWRASFEELKVVSCQYEVSLLPPLTKPCFRLPHSYTVDLVEPGWTPVLYIFQEIATKISLLRDMIF